MTLIVLLFSENVSWEVFTNHKVTYDMVYDGKYIYAGTNGGLLVFSPEEEKFINKYTHLDGLPHNIINSLVIDDKKRIWIGTENGLAIYKDKTITSYPIEKIPYQKITALAAEGNTVAVGTPLGIYVIKTKENFKEDVVYFIKENLSSREIVSMVIHNDSLWVGTDKGVILIKIDTKPEIIKDFHTSPVDTMINDMLVYNDTIFILTPKALCFFNGNNFEIISSLILGDTNNPWTLGKMLRVDDSTFYIGSSQATISIRYGDSVVLRTFFAFYSPEKNPVKNLQPYLKTSHGIWFGWFKWGDNKYTGVEYADLFLKGDKKKMYNFPCIPSNGLNRSCVTPDAGIWTANCIDIGKIIAHGLGHYVSNSFWERYNPSYDSLIGSSIWQIEVDSKGRLYLGHRWTKRGLVRFDPTKNEIKSYSWETGIPNIIYAIARDKYDRIWVYRWGVTEIDVFDTSFTLIAKIPWKYGFTHRIVCDDTSMWAGTDEGIIHYTPSDFEKNLTFGTYEKWDDSRGLPTKEITCIAVGKDGKIWGASKEGGFLLNPITEEVNKIISSNISWIDVDKEGRVYFLERYNGLSIYDPFTKKWSYYHKNNSKIVPADEYLHVYTDTLFNRVLISTAGWGLSVMKLSAPEFNSPDSITIYPNPFYKSQKRIIIQPLPSNAKVYIYSISGKLVRKFEKISPDYKKVEWFVDSLSPGIYIVIVITPEFKKVLKFTVLE